jgi:hypothetical protein
MGWERRKRGGWYYTRSRRVNGQVVREYVGAGDLAGLAARHDAEERNTRARAERELKRERESLAANDERLSEIRAVSNLLIRAELLLAGLHKHKGQWRRRGGRQGR